MATMASLSTPSEMSSDAICRVPGKTEFAKLLVSVVIPAIRHSPTGPPKSAPCGMAFRIRYTISQAEETSQQLNTRSNSSN